MDARILLRNLAAACLLAMSEGSAAADDTGVANIHTQRRVGSKICFTDHDHDGSGTGRDQATAMREGAPRASEARKATCFPGRLSPRNGVVSGRGPLAQ